MHRGPIGASTDDPSGTVRMRHGNPSWHFHPPNTTFRGPTGNSTEPPTGTVRVRPGNPIWHFSHPSI
eukprot:7641794-Pyramimonas_sp.AAC.1